MKRKKQISKKLENGGGKIDEKAGEKITTKETVEKGNVNEIKKENI